MGVFRGCTDGFDTGQLSWHLIPEIKVLYSRTQLDTKLCIHHLLPNFYHYLSKSFLTVFPALSKLDHFSFRQWFSSPEVSRAFPSIIYEISSDSAGCWNHLENSQWVQWGRVSWLHHLFLTHSALSSSSCSAAQCFYFIIWYETTFRGCITNRKHLCANNRSMTKHFDLFSFHGSVRSAFIPWYQFMLCFNVLFGFVVPFLIRYIRDIIADRIVHWEDF